MSSVYTGVGGNVTPSTSPTETIPSDGDPRNVASVNPAFQKLLDYVAQVYQVLTGAGQANVSNQAAKLAAGGAGSPAKGAANLVPQAAPSAPDNGDVWIESGATGSLKARLNGATTSVPIAITPAGTWTSDSGIAYWKTPDGMVHLKGRIIFQTSAPATMFTLPAGYRPLFTRKFALASINSVTTALPIQIDSSGNVATGATLAVNDGLYLEGMHFLAEQ